MSNKQLEQMLADGKAMHKGIGGTSLPIEVDNTPIFVKKVPITDLELQPENYMSTANILNLPMYYQYGIGSTGFGAWRELAAHVMTTNGVHFTISFCKKLSVTYFCINSLCRLKSRDFSHSEYFAHHFSKTNLKTAKSKKPSKINGF